MRLVTNAILAGGLLLAAAAAPLQGQEISVEIRESIDAVIASAYQSAATGLPCKVKTRGKPKILRWEVVDRCLNDAAGRVNYEEISRRLEEIRAQGKIAPDRFSGPVEDSLTAHALPFEKILTVGEPQTLLPLTNSLLKFLPPDALMGLPVTDKFGNNVGTFEGVFSYERTGGLATTNTYRLSLFQYRDARGNIQFSADKLLLDSFGVPWTQAKAQRGLRLQLDRLLPPR